MLRVFLLLTVAFIPSVASGADGDINAADTTWLLVSAALVMLMVPGLALFYGGMVRRKNVLSTLMHSFIILCIVSVLWVLWGYSLSFGPDFWMIIGSLKWFGLRGIVSEAAPAAPTVPHLVFVMFQGMFAAITPALITGAFAERIKFSAVVVFSVLWVTLVYAPVAHWVWGGGWIGEKVGALDFAGGTVVHINSAIAALVAAIVVGRRKGYLEEPIVPHNLTMTFLGASLLWFGWFGFNAGSALSAGHLAALAFTTTNTAAASGALGWTFIEWILKRRPTALGAVSGAVAGLVAITPAAGYVSALSSILIGLLAGVLCFLGVSLKPRLGYDDSLDVLGIHGVGGTWGALATGLFASTAVNPAGANGMFFGNPSLFLKQLIGVVATIIFCFVLSLLIFKVIDWTIGLRVSEEDEIKGLDLSQHGEEGYSL